jgi:hypothetical protein
MKKLKKILILFVLCLSFFSVKVSYAEESLNDILWAIFWEETMDTDITMTPLEKAREKLKSYDRWTEFITVIDGFVEKKKSDKEYLQRISTKVKAFDLSKYNSPVSNKDATLAAVIWYIDALLDDAIAKLSY